MSEPFNAEATEDAIQILADRITAPIESPIFVHADGVGRQFIFHAIQHLDDQLHAHLRGDKTL